MAAQSNEDLGKLVLRVTVGVLISFHAIAFIAGDGGMVGRLVAWGLPAQTAWLGILMELGGALLMILGIYARLGGLMVGVFMIAALLLAHSGINGAPNHLFSVGQNAANTHWDHYLLEVQMFYLLGAFSVYFLGAGRYGVNTGGNWN